MRIQLVIIFFTVTISCFSQKAESIETTIQSRLDTIASMIKLNKGDVIADIGSGSGRNLIRLSKYFPPITYFVEDIDTTVCNRQNFKKTINYFNPKVSIDSFRFFYGNDSSTNLPKKYFDKVFLIAVMHEFNYRNSMLTEIKKIIKKNGEIIIEEPLVKHIIPKDKGCNNAYFTEQEFKQILFDNQIDIIQQKFIKDKDITNNRYRKVYLCKTKGSD